MMSCPSEIEDKALTSREQVVEVRTRVTRCKQLVKEIGTRGLELALHLYQLSRGDWQACYESWADCYEDCGVSRSTATKFIAAIDGWIEKRGVNADSLAGIDMEKLYLGARLLQVEPERDTEETLEIVREGRRQDLMALLTGEEPDHRKGIDHVHVPAMAEGATPWTDIVRQMRCLVCGSAPAEPHHFPPRSVGGDLMKDVTFPLCRKHHASFGGSEGARGLGASYLLEMVALSWMMGRFHGRIGAKEIWSIGGPLKPWAKGDTDADG